MNPYDAITHELVFSLGAFVMTLVVYSGEGMSLPKRIALHVACIILLYFIMSL